MRTYTARPQKPEATDTDRTDPDDTLELAATGAGSLVFEQITENRDGTTVITAKRLIGHGVIRGASTPRGYQREDTLMANDDG